MELPPVFWGVCVVTVLSPGPAVLMTLGNALTDRRAEVARVQDLRRRIVDVEVARRVEEVGRDDHQPRARQIEHHALVGDGLEPLLDQAIDAEVGDEALPQRRAVGLGVGGHQPAVGGGDDVGILVRQEQVAQLAAAQVPHRRRHHPVVDLVPTRIEDEPGPAMDDQVLVRLDGEAAIERLQQDVAVDPVIEQHGLVGHARSSAPRGAARSFTGSS